MTSPDDYRQFAMDCLRWADEAKDASQRHTLTQLARTWMLTASEMDAQTITVVSNPEVLHQQLRDTLE
jgi:hypothetical protein